MLLLLRMKTSYMQTLPWLFAGLAHTSQAAAQEVASKVLEQWRKDPRPQAHHRIAAKLMQNCDFVAALESYASGADFAALPADFQLQVSAFWFVPVVETTIEEKHARVAINKKRHHLGPVRISLANRLPLLDRWLRRGHVTATNLLDKFSAARSLKKVAGMLRVDDHPGLQGVSHPSSLRRVLAKVIYHCDPRDM